MGTLFIGRGVRVEVQKTIAGAAKVLTGITKASPAVAACVGHGLAFGVCGYLSGVEGMVQLEGQAVRVGSSPTADSLQLLDIDTRDYPDFTGNTDLWVVTAWDTLGTTTGYEKGGGEADTLDATALIHDIKQEVTGQLAAQSVQFQLNIETVRDAAMQTVEESARRALDLVFRVTAKDGAARVFRGVPSLPGESLQKSAIATGSYSVKVKGFVVQGAAS